MGRYYAVNEWVDMGLYQHTLYHNITIYQHTLYYNKLLKYIHDTSSINASIIKIAGSLIHVGSLHLCMLQRSLQVEGTLYFTTQPSFFRQVSTQVYIQHTAYSREVGQQLNDCAESSTTHQQRATRRTSHMEKKRATKTILDYAKTKLHFFLESIHHRCLFKTTISHILTFHYNLNDSRSSSTGRHLHKIAVSV